MSRSARRPEYAKALTTAAQFHWKIIFLLALGSGAWDPFPTAEGADVTPAPHLPAVTGKDLNGKPWKAPADLPADYCTLPPGVAHATARNGPHDRRANPSPAVSSATAREPMREAAKPKTERAGFIRARFPLSLMFCDS